MPTPIIPQPDPTAPANTVEAPMEGVTTDAEDQSAQSAGNDSNNQDHSPNRAVPVGQANLANLAAMFDEKLVVLEDKITFLEISTKTRIEQISRRVSDCMRSNDRTNDKVATIQKLVAASKDQLVETGKKLDSTNEELASTKAELATVKKQTRLDETNFDRVKTLFSSARKRIETVSDKVDATKDVVLNAQEKVDRLGLQMLDHGSEVSKMRKLGAELKTAGEATDRQIDESKKDLEQHRKDVQDFRHEGHVNRVELEKLKSLVEEQQATIDENRVKLEKSQLTNERQQAVIERQEAMVEAQRKRIDKLEAVVERLLAS